MYIHTQDSFLQIFGKMYVSKFMLNLLISANPHIYTKNDIILFLFLNNKCPYGYKVQI